MKNQSKGQRPVHKKDVSGNIIETYCSIYDAAKKTGCNQSNISKCCLGKAKTVGGYRWVFADEEQTQPTSTVWMWRFPKHDEDVIKAIQDNHSKNFKSIRGKKKTHLMVPKYLYLVHQLIQEQTEANPNGSKKINLEKFAKIISDNKWVAGRIVHTWIKLGVVEVLSGASKTGKTDQDGKELWTSATYQLTDAYKKGYKVKETFTVIDGAMIVNMANNLTAVEVKPLLLEREQFNQQTSEEAFLDSLTTNNPPQSKADNSRPVVQAVVETLLVEEPLKDAPVVSLEAEKNEWSQRRTHSFCNQWLDEYSNSNDFREANVATLFNIMNRRFYDEFINSTDTDTRNQVSNWIYGYCEKAVMKRA